jgi:hypothetical protein
LFWWLTQGMEGPDGGLVMPGFGDRLDEDDRWNLIDYIRAHNAGLAVTPQGQWTRPMKAPDASVIVDDKPVALSSLRGRLLQLIAVTSNSPPPLPPDSGIALSRVSLTPQSDAWAAYSIVSGIAQEALEGTEFLIDSDGWLRGVFKPVSPGVWPDPEAFLAAARQAQENPIFETEGGFTHIHH